MTTSALLRRQKPRAGRRAEARYRELRARWRRRVLGRFRLVLWPLMIVSLLGAAAPVEWRWPAGACFGSFLIMYLWARDAVPRHIEQWLDGAQGERWTEQRLVALEKAGWHVAHDLEGPRGNIDHIVVGPAGVFLLDSKNWFGVVEVANGVATVTPRDNPDAAWSATGLSRKMRAMSAANKEALQRLTGIRIWVEPVVVVWAPFGQKVVKSEGVTYVAGEHVADWLGTLPQRLDSGQQRRLAAVVVGG